MDIPSIHITRMALKGDGIGKTPDGKVAFVSYTVPEDVVKVQKCEEKKNYSRFWPVAVSTPSPSRVTPLCPLHFQPGKRDSWCGGCDWQHIHASDAVRIKSGLVADTLRTLGGIDSPPMKDPIASPQTWRYRNKVQIPFGWDPHKRTLVAGFYAPQSHQIVEFDDCLAQSELSIRIFKAVKTFAVQRRWVPYDKDRHHGWLRHLLIRTNSNNQALVALITKGSQIPDADAFVPMLRQSCPEIVGLFQNIQNEQTNVILGDRWVRLWGETRLCETLSGLNIYFSPGAFMQVNSPAAELMYQKAIDLLAPAPDWTVMDLYCGVGAMALLASRRARRVIGVESVESAIVDAQWNAEKNHIKNISFVRSSVESYMGRMLRQSSHGVNPEKLGVIVDPPRAGCKPEVIQGLLRLDARRMVYVSCDPATLARDLNLLSRRYRCDAVIPVDLFPQTSHIETVVLLNRRDT